MTRVVLSQFIFLYQFFQVMGWEDMCGSFAGGIWRATMTVSERVLVVGPHADERW